MTVDKFSDRRIILLIFVVLTSVSYVSNAYIFRDTFPQEAAVPYALSVGAVWTILAVYWFYERQKTPAELEDERKAMQESVDKEVKDLKTQFEADYMAGLTPQQRHTYEQRHAYARLV